MDLQASDKIFTPSHKLLVAYRHSNITATFLLGAFAFQFLFSIKTNQEGHKESTNVKKRKPQPAT